MRTTHLLIIAFLFLLIGCAKEEPVQSEFDMLKAAKLPIPMKVNFTATLDPQSPTISCTPELYGLKLTEKVWLSGTGTHLGKASDDDGKLDNGKSYSISTECSFIDATHLNEIFYGTIFTENGDSFDFTGSSVVDISNVLLTQTGTMTGEISVESGEGRFKNVKGKITMTGTLDFKIGSMDWDGDGYLIYE